MSLFENKLGRRPFGVAVAINREASFNLLLFNQRKLLIAVSNFTTGIKGTRG